uniref:Uncharacterized protein n=1 Tax=Arundo donax TaxID=35708 RepID=A0A0A9CQJ4_ARUDO
MVTCLEEIKVGIRIQLHSSVQCKWLNFFCFLKNQYEGGKLKLPGGQGTKDHKSQIYYSKSDSQV